MLQEAGILGCLVVMALIVWELTKDFQQMGLIFQG